MNKILCLLLLAWVANGAYAAGTSVPGKAKIGDVAVIKDSRNGESRAYKIQFDGNVWWMIDNLKHGSAVQSDVGIGGLPWGTKVCYDDTPSNCEKYGGLYDLSSAKAACPEGWHLPTAQEFAALSARVADESAPWNQQIITKAVTDGGISLLLETEKGFPHVDVDIGYEIKGENGGTFGANFWILADGAIAYISVADGNKGAKITGKVIQDRGTLALTLQKMLAIVREIQLAVEYGKQNPGSAAADSNPEYKKFKENAILAAVMGSGVVPADKAFFALSSATGIQNLFAPVRCVKEAAR